MPCRLSAFGCGPGVGRRRRRRGLRAAIAHGLRAGDAPLIFLLHGFPEFWFGWRLQIAPLAEAGFRVVAPDTRGYNLSSKPDDFEAYAVDLLAADIRGLIGELGAESALLVGHDWGGSIAWTTAMNHPEWTIGRENVVLDEAGGSIAFRFDARDAHLVLSPGAQEPIPFRVLVDGEPPGPSHGVDVDSDGNGVLDYGRMYQLVRARDTVRERTLSNTFLLPGAEAYAFTFG
jgi:pimeloyl-ACP methyl ester carboxylesterase